MMKFFLIILALEEAFFATFIANLKILYFNIDKAKKVMFFLAI
jgi:hypothetical protein